jgi:hypothetical protein
MNTVPYGLARRCKLTIKKNKKKKKIFRKHSELKNVLYNFFLKMKIKHKEFKKGWLFLYKKRSKKLKYLSIDQYKKYLNFFVNSRHIKRRKKRLKIFNKYKRKFNFFGEKKKKRF